MASVTLPEIPCRISTKQHIANVTEALLGVMPQSDISVKMIVSAAQISKTTFYRHFKDINDVVLWIYISNVDKVVEESSTFEDLSLGTYRFMREKPSYMQRALSYTQQNSLSEYIFIRSKSDITRIVKKKLQKEQLEPELMFSISFFCAGCRETWSNWVKDGMKESPEDVVCGIISNIPDSLKPFLKPQK